MTAWGRNFFYLKLEIILKSQFFFSIKLEVEVSVLVLSLSNIRDIEMQFTAKFQLSLQWIDKRLTFKDLRDGKYFEL